MLCERGISYTRVALQRSGKEQLKNPSQLRFFASVPRLAPWLVRGGSAHNRITVHWSLVACLIAVALLREHSYAWLFLQRFLSVWPVQPEAHVAEHFQQCESCWCQHFCSETQASCLPEPGDHIFRPQRNTTSFSAEKCSACYNFLESSLKVSWLPDRDRLAGTVKRLLSKHLQEHRLI